MSGWNPRLVAASVAIGVSQICDLAATVNQSRFMWLVPVSVICLLIAVASLALEKRHRNKPFED